MRRGPQPAAAKAKAKAKMKAKVWGRGDAVLGAGEAQAPGKTGGVGVRDQFGVANGDWREAELAGKHRWLLGSLLLPSRLVAAQWAAIRADHGFTT